jgi:hypothetical protein
MTRLALVLGLVIALFASVHGALAEKPAREFVLVGSDVIQGFCPFDVLLDPTQANLYALLA